MERLLASLIDRLRDYAECYPNESTTVSAFFNLLESWPNSLKRTHFPGHFTASAWVVDPDREKVLLLHHRKLDRWLQPGGHADGDGDLIRVARRELFEETGIDAEETSSRIFDIDIHDIPAFGETPEHQHFDVRFFLTVDDSVQPISNHESHEVRRHPLSSIERLTTEESIARMVRKTPAWRD